jgi:hypothetical protein
MRRLLAVLLALALLGSLVLAGAAEASTTTYRYKNKNGLRMTGKRIEYLSKRALHRKFAIDRYGPLLFCGRHGYAHGSCDFLLTTKARHTWCGNTYVRAYRTVVKVVIKATRSGCGDF